MVREGMVTHRGVQRHEDALRQPVLRAHRERVSEVPVLLPERRGRDDDDEHVVRVDGGVSATTAAMACSALAEGPVV